MGDQRTVRAFENERELILAATADRDVAALDPHPRRFRRRCLSPAAVPLPPHVGVVSGGKLRSLTTTPNQAGDEHGNYKNTC